MIESKQYSNAIRDIKPEQIIPGVDTLWVERIPPPDETRGGIILQGITQEEEAMYCVVRSVGPGMDVDVAAIGDVIALRAYEGEEVVFNDRKFFLAEVNQIRAKLDIQPEELAVEAPGLAVASGIDTASAE